MVAATTTCEQNGRDVFRKRYLRRLCLYDTGALESDCSSGKRQSNGERRAVAPRLWQVPHSNDDFYRNRTLVPISRLDQFCVYTFVFTPEFQESRT
jgi:hypothetical protein